MPFDTQAFKDTMASVAASVTIVTTDHTDGPVGLTVSAFNSVSADPPIVLVCLDKVIGSLPVFLEADGFTVNFLPEGTEDLAMLFATRGADRFGQSEWRPSNIDGAGPILSDAFAHFACRVTDTIEMGDHWVVFGEVVDGAVPDGTIAPLMWHGRGFARVVRGD